MARQPHRLPSSPFSILEGDPTGVRVSCQPHHVHAKPRATHHTESSVLLSPCPYGKGPEPAHMTRGRRVRFFTVVVSLPNGNHAQTSGMPRPRFVLNPAHSSRLPQQRDQYPRHRAQHVDHHEGGVGRGHANHFVSRVSRFARSALVARWLYAPSSRASRSASVDIGSSATKDPVPPPGGATGQS